MAPATPFCKEQQKRDHNAVEERRGACVRDWAWSVSLTWRITIISTIMNRIGSTWRWALACRLFVVFDYMAGVNHFATQDLIAGGVQNRNKGNVTMGTKYNQFWLDLVIFAGGNIILEFALWYYPPSSPLRHFKEILLWHAPGAVHVGCRKVQ